MKWDRVWTVIVLALLGTIAFSGYKIEQSGCIFKIMLVGLFCLLGIIIAINLIVYWKKIKSDMRLNAENLTEKTLQELKNEISSDISKIKIRLDALEKSKNDASSENAELKKRLDRMERFVKL